jgi:hypothetical protein
MDMQLRVSYTVDKNRDRMADHDRGAVNGCAPHRDFPVATPCAAAG